MGRTMLTRRAFITFGAVAAGSLIAACGVSTPERAERTSSSTGEGGSPGTATAASATAPPVVGKSGGTLTVAIFADPITFDPALAGNIQGREACRAIHDTLFTVDQHGNLAPKLVESWTQPDAKTYTLRLRRGVKFHDGTPFNAEAVKYNLERIRNPATNSIRAGEISAMDSIEVVDEFTVRITLKTPFAAFLFPLTDVAGAMGSPAAFEKWGDNYGLHPSGTGPFKFVSYQKDSETILEKNGDYWAKGQPYVDKLVLRPIPVDSTRLAALLSGEVQIAESLPLQVIKQLRESGQIQVSEKVGFRWEYFGFNLHPEYPGYSKAFRQAFQWAIDREALHQTAYFGTGSIAYDGILPGTPFYDASYQPYTYDIDKAKRLIDQSGISLPVTIEAPLIPDPPKQRAAQLFQAAAQELGVTITISQVDTAGYRAVLASGTLAIDLQGWWGYRPDPDQYLYTLLHSQGSYAQYHHYNNPQMDKLIDAERAATSKSERRTIFRQISQLMNEDAVYVPWHYSSDFKGLAKNVRGFIHYQDGIPRFEEIWLE